MAKQFSLGKKQRLKSRKLIDQLFKEGKKLSVPPLRVHYSTTSDSTSGPLQFGVAAGSKVFKRAVDRNRIKRLIREAFRLQKNFLQEKLKEKNICLHVFFVYTGRELPQYTEIESKMQTALNKLQDQVNRTF